MNLVAPGDVLEEVLVLLLIQLLQNSVLPHVQRRPQYLHGVLRVVLLAEDFLELYHLLLQQKAVTIY